jgi:urease accessory protein
VYKYVFLPAAPLAGTHLPEETTVNAGPGTGILDVARVDRRSVVRRAYATSPLRWLTPRNHGPAAWVYASSYGGGLVGGDTLRLTISIGAGASAFVSSQASTKIYRSRDRSSAELEATVSAGGHLVLWPDPVVCYAGSTFRQTQCVDLTDDAALILVDTMTSGRRASGERWQLVEYATRITVRQDGRVVLFDSTRLSGEEGDLAARMGRFDVLSAAAIVGPRFRDDTRAIMGTTAARPIEKRADLLVSAAPLGDSGCLLRVAGRSIEQVTGIVREYLSFLSCLLGDDPWTRKW